jgi:hypothetical protein
MQTCIEFLFTSLQWILTHICEQMFVSETLQSNQYTFHLHLDFVKPYDYRDNHIEFWEYARIFKLYVRTTFSNLLFFIFEELSHGALEAFNSTRLPLHFPLLLKQKFKLRTAPLCFRYCGERSHNYSPVHSMSGGSERDRERERARSEWQMYPFRIHHPSRWGSFLLELS